MKTELFDVVILGGGPAGIAAALSVESNLSLCIIEREEHLGGILKQCIHDGFGLIRYKEKLTGPEYAYRELEKLSKTTAVVKLETFVTKLIKNENEFVIEAVNKDGVTIIKSKTLILAMGCRERSEQQVFITGNRLAGVYTAGVAQYYINILGLMVAKKVVILGSGDIGLIMARRLTLEGAKVVGVYEIKSEPSGLTRNIVQCLNDFNIPLHLSTTVTKVNGKGRLSSVVVQKVDSSLKLIEGTEETIECDTLILSVGLIPENDILSNLNVEFDNKTKGPKVNQYLETSVEGMFSCGNSLHVQDLVDYVSETGELSGKAASNYLINGNCEKQSIEIEAGKNIFTVVPSCIDLNSRDKIFSLYFRSSKTIKNCTVKIYTDSEVIKELHLDIVKPPEMEKVTLLLDLLKDKKHVKIEIGDIQDV